MTIEEIYTQLGGNYNDVLERLMKPERIQKYLIKFTQNTDYNDMMNALQAQNYADAFRFSHNLKGMAGNLSLTKLFLSSQALCESLRNGPPTVDITGMIAQVKQDYEETLAVLNTIPQI